MSIDVFFKFAVKIKNNKMSAGHLEVHGVPLSKGGNVAD